MKDFRAPVVPAASLVILITSISIFTVYEMHAKYGISSLEQWAFVFGFVALQVAVISSVLGERIRVRDSSIEHRIFGLFTSTIYMDQVHSLGWKNVRQIGKSIGNKYVYLVLQMKDGSRKEISFSNVDSHARDYVSKKFSRLF